MIVIGNKFIFCVMYCMVFMFFMKYLWGFYGWKWVSYMRLLMKLLFVIWLFYFLSLDSLLGFDTFSSHVTFYEMFWIYCISFLLIAKDFGMSLLMKGYDCYGWFWLEFMEMSFKSMVHKLNGNNRGFLLFDMSKNEYVSDWISFYNNWNSEDNSYNWVMEKSTLMDVFSFPKQMGVLIYYVIYEYLKLFNSPFLFDAPFAQVKYLLTEFKAYGTMGWNNIHHNWDLYDVRFEYSDGRMSPNASYHLFYTLNDPPFGKLAMQLWGDMPSRMHFVTNPYAYVSGKHSSEILFKKNGCVFHNSMQTWNCWRYLEKDFTPYYSNLWWKMKEDQFAVFDTSVFKNVMNKLGVWDFDDFIFTHLSKLMNWSMQMNSSFTSDYSKFFSGASMNLQNKMEHLVFNSYISSLVCSLSMCLVVVCFMVYVCSMQNYQHANLYMYSIMMPFSLLFSNRDSILLKEGMVYKVSKQAYVFVSNKGWYTLESSLELYTFLNKFLWVNFLMLMMLLTNIVYMFIDYMDIFKPPVWKKFWSKKRHYAQELFAGFDMPLFELSLLGVFGVLTVYSLYCLFSIIVQNYKYSMYEYGWVRSMLKIEVFLACLAGLLLLVFDMSYDNMMSVAKVYQYTIDLQYFMHFGAMKLFLWIMLFKALFMGKFVDIWYWE